MATFREQASWLVVEIAQGFGCAMLAGKLLADVGCTVARIEDAHFDDDEATPSEVALTQLVVRGKHSIALDWNGRASEVLDALLARAEVLVVDREGLARVQRLVPEGLHRRYPRLTVLACTPFGLESPLAEWTGGEEIVQAAGGIMSITGHPGSGPTRVAGIPLTYAAAMFAVTSATCDAMRKRTGHGGSLLDVCVYDAAIAFQSASFPAFWLTGRAPEGIGNRHSMSVPWNSFRCSDGWVIVCGGNQPNWVRLCAVIGRPDLVADPRFATQQGRIEHVEEIDGLIAAWMAERTVAEVEALLRDNTIAGGSILPLRDVVRHPQFMQRELATRASGGRQAGGVFHVDRAPMQVTEGAWTRGAGARAMLVDRCGVASDVHARWVADGTLVEEERHA